MAVTALGLGVVGISSFLDGGSGGSQSHLLGVGIAFILAGQFCNAVQMVVEESFVKNKGVKEPNFCFHFFSKRMI